MKPIYTTLIIVAVGLVIAYGIYYYFTKKAPSFDMEAYNRIGSQGIVQGNGDYPYCTNCGGNGNGEQPISNAINYRDSGSVSDPTFLAGQRALQMMS